MSFGVGEVIRIYDDNEYPILVKFKDSDNAFTSNFKWLTRFVSRDLYWQKPNIIPPPKLKKKVTFYDWYIEWKIDKMHKNGINRVYGLTEDEIRIMYPNDLIQKIDGTEREVEV